MSRVCRLQRQIRILVLTSALALFGCDGNAPPPLIEHGVRPAVVQKDIGSHSVSFAVPRGWQHIDLGARQRFKNGTFQMEIEDLGPVAPQAVARHVRKSRDLYRYDSQLAAVEYLKRLEYVQLAFPNKGSWRYMERDWIRLLSPGGSGHDDQGTDSRQLQTYDRVIAELNRQAPVDLNVIAHRILQFADRNGQRDIADELEGTLDGRQTITIDTWDELSHQWRVKHFFVLNKDNLLHAHGSSSGDEKIAGSFQKLIESLRFSNQAR